MIVNTLHRPCVLRVCRHIDENAYGVGDLADGRERPGQEHSHVAAGKRLVWTEGAILVRFGHSEVGQPLQIAQVPGIVGHIGESAGGQLRIAT